MRTAYSMSEQSEGHPIHHPIAMPCDSIDNLDLEAITGVLGPRPPVSYAAAHAYPASAPAFTPAPLRQRQAAAGNRLRLYAHVPFCAYRCSFCFFAVRVGAQRQEMERYVQVLLRELEWAQPGTPLIQLFMGGGTPTLLPPDLLDRLLGGIFARLPSQGDQLHCVESSPDSITPAHLDVLVRHGIGRISMGTQSLHDDQLGDVNRLHTAQQTLDACHLVMDSGLVLNIDLMYGLPGQTMESFRRDWATLAEIGVPSLTVYDLRLNERTSVARDLRQSERLGLEQLIEWRSFVAKTARDFGFSQTRWHTFKRMNTPAARHQRAPHHDAAGRGYQLGIGLSARSQLGNVVYRNHSDMGTYLERVESGVSPVEQVIELQNDDRRTQYVMTTLGDGRSLDRADYAATFGEPFEVAFGEPTQRLLAGGLLEEEGQVLRLSPVGRLLYDRVAYNFYPARVLEWLNGRRPPARAVAVRPGA